MMARALAILIAVVTVALTAGQARASSPDPAGIQSGLRVGAAMFGTPSCGTPTVAVLALGASDGRAGQARMETCGIELEASYPWTDPAQACTIVAHEEGHLALGPVFGGSDPWHSTDPRSVMYPSPFWLTACSPPPTVRPTPRVRRVRIHRVKWGKGKVRHRRARTLRAVIR